MLRLLQEDAAALGLANIRTVRSGWEDFTPDRRYEVVFASMTPALDSEAGKEKLLTCAADWVVYMGFLDRMASDLMQGLYARYSITPRVFNNAQVMHQWLTARGIACTALPVKGQWVVSRNRADALDVCATTLQHYGVDPDPDLLAAHIAAFRDDSGAYVERTDYTIEMLLWQNS
jgi:hypothetical protein